MKDARTSRALDMLAKPDALLAKRVEGGYGVYPRGDRRRRPLARVTADEVRQWRSDGALVEAGQPDQYFLSEAGRAMARRFSAGQSDPYVTQHHAPVVRHVADADGQVREANGLELNTTIKRLAALRDAAGACWLSTAELAAAQWLRAAWERSQAGLVKGSDWQAPPKSGAGGRGNALEAAMARRCDTGRALGEALEGLAAPLRRVVVEVCLHDRGLEALERAEGWPARSGKIALKMGLAQLASRRS